MSERKSPDWEEIEREYRAGQLSVRAIAAQHGLTEGAIRKRAKADGWARPLADKVRAAVKEKLVRAEGTQTERARTDAETIEVAAARGVELVRQHRASLNRANTIVAKLLDELESATDKRDEITDEIEAATEGDRNPNRRNAMLRAVSLPSRAQTVRELSQAMKNLIPLERQAFNLDSEAPTANYEISDRPLNDDEWAARHATEH
ncbi:MAG: hypothetical protein P4M05_19510 [Bradyrhizobium sp.]|nr:hypothetical protein [Bradyrhizobium sp.]